MTASENTGLQARLIITIVCISTIIIRVNINYHINFISTDQLIQQDNQH